MADTPAQSDAEIVITGSGSGPDRGPSAAAAGVEDLEAAVCQEIRRLREAAGLTQSVLAKNAGFARQHLSRTENPANGLPSENVVNVLDTVLGAGGSLIKLWVRAAGSRRDRRQDLAQVGRATIGRPSESTIPATSLRLAGTSLPREAGAVEESAHDVEALLMAAAEESGDFLSWAESSNVGELTLEQMHADIRRVARSYLKVPTVPLFMRTKALRDRGIALLRGHQNPSHSRDLYALVGWSLGMLSWISVDLGRPEIAETHARAAWRCADRADLNPLRAWVRATQHTAAFWQADYETAAVFARDGLAYADKGTGRLFLASALALDLAYLGDVPGTELAVRRARDVADKTEPMLDEVPGPFTCSIDRAGSLWSDSELALGRADTAVVAADRAVAAFEAADERSRNRGSERMARLQQVKARLLLGDVRAAEQALDPVLATAADHQVGPLVRRLTEVGALAKTVGLDSSGSHRLPAAATRICAAVEIVTGVKQ